jgi:hydroxycarboxylate dehydrogenase B
MKLHAPDRLRDITTATFLAAGWPEADAAEVARHFVLANLSGHDSHGIGMLPLYAKAITDGLLTPANMPQDKIALAPFLVIDAQVALGQPTARRAVARAAEMALAGGVGILNLLDAHHIGRIGDYAEQAAALGLVSMFWVNVAGRSPIVAPHGSREARWGTNPHAIGVPNGDAPLILDFATSRMAHGKARVALNKGVEVADGYLIDAEGHASNDPAVVFPPLPMGALLPFGDHKGAGIAMIAEIFSAGLSGGALIETKPVKSWIINSLFGILIDPARLEPDAAARAARVAAIASFVRSAKPRDGFDKVRAPGDVERETRITRQVEGIPLDDETWRQIVEAAGQFGVKVA